MTNSLPRNLSCLVKRACRTNAGAAAFALLLGGAAGVFLDAAIAADATAHSTGKADAGVGTNAPLNLLSDGTTAVYTQATSGGVAKTNENPEKDNAVDKGPAKKTVRFKDKTGAQVNFPNGIGDTGSKFDKGVPVTQTYSSVSRAPAAKGNRVVSSADATYTGTRAGGGKFGSTLSANAAVTLIGQNAVGSGVAAAQASDPLMFDPLTSGVLSLDYALGSTTIFLDPATSSPLPSLSLGSNTANGSVHFDTGVSLFGVKFGSTDVNGEIFRIVIEGTGVIDGKDDLDIAFRPASFLGFSLSQIDLVEDEIFNALTALPDGGFGLGAGSALSIFGDSALLGPLLFSHTTAQFRFEDTLAAGAALAPIPSGFALVLLGLGLLGWQVRRRAVSI